jgi:hypothetical protein
MNKNVLNHSIPSLFEIFLTQFFLQTVASSDFGFSDVHVSPSILPPQLNVHSDDTVLRERYCKFLRKSPGHVYRVLLDICFPPNQNIEVFVGTFKLFIQIDV